jgi:hypothetical protein
MVLLNLALSAAKPKFYLIETVEKNRHFNDYNVKGAV